MGKLNRQIAEAIRKEWRWGLSSQLSEKYWVGKRAIQRIVRNESYRFNPERGEAIKYLKENAVRMTEDQILEFINDFIILSKKWNI